MIKKCDYIICNHFCCRFCPSVFFYLLSVVPAIWFLELHEMEARIKEREATQLNNSITAPIFNMTEEQLSLDVAELGVTV